MSTPSFAELGISRPVTDALSKRGIEAPFPVQRLVLEDLLAGHDVMVKSPTGSGKTLAFGLPVIERTAADARRPAALILAPTRELAQQIVEEIRGEAHSRALKITSVYGGAGIIKQAKLAKQAHILVATPGRLIDLMERREITLEHVRTLVLDEADRMLDMGFRPAVDRIVKQIPRDRQTVVLSATLDGDAGRLAEEYTKDARRHEHETTEQTKGEIEHRFVRVPHDAKHSVLMKELEADERDLALVFVRTKHGADRLAKRLTRDGVKAVAIHGNRTQAQREKALSSFERGDVDTLVATDVAARGIDVRGVTHVINFDAPPLREDYIHRIGRTGRAGNTGIGITFVMDDQAVEMGKIARDLELEAEFAAAGFRPAQTLEPQRGNKHRGPSQHRKNNGPGARSGSGSGSSWRTGSGPRSGSGSGSTGGSDRAPRSGSGAGARSGSGSGARSGSSQRSGSGPRGGSSSGSRGRTS